MKRLWHKEQEFKFFTEALEYAMPEDLFYLADDGSYYAYWPKGYRGVKTTLQSRNALIGTFTERWSADLLHDFAEDMGHYVVKGAVCDEIGLPRQSNADVAVCKTAYVNQRPEDILLIVEVKMSIVWNWELQISNNEEELICIGDYTKHQGTPGLLRSDSMLKAIGKSINVRVSSSKASKIPIIVLGNTPITENYYEKVDHLARSGVIQGFWSVNSNPLDSNRESVKSTAGLGFRRFDTYDELIARLHELLQEEREFFSSMRTKRELGEIVEVANHQDTYHNKADKFLALIRE